MEAGRRRRDGGLFLRFLSFLSLVFEAGAGEEEADCDAGAFFCGFLVSLSSSLPLFSKKERKALVPVLCVFDDEDETVGDWCTG